LCGVHGSSLQYPKHDGGDECAEAEKLEDVDEEFGHGVLLVKEVKC
jgi:hypothetical protein